MQIEKILREKGGEMAKIREKRQKMKKVFESHPLNEAPMPKIKGKPVYCMDDAKLSHRLWLMGQS